MLLFDDPVEVEVAVGTEGVEGSLVDKDDAAAVIKSAAIEAVFDDAEPLAATPVKVAEEEVAGDEVNKLVGGTLEMRGEAGREIRIDLRGEGGGGCISSSELNMDEADGDKARED